MSIKHVSFYFKWKSIVLMILLNLCIVCNVFADGVTIITHGWNPSVSGTPVWLESMRNAVSDNHLSSEQKYGIIKVIKSGTSLSATCDPWDFDLSLGTSGEILIILNWSEVADHLKGGPPAQDVAAVIINKIIDSQNNKAPIAELPIHLIGHSRGGGMICEIARLLGEKGIIVDHLTPLDPHPLTASDPQPILTKIIDTPAAIYENIVFADVYLQNAEYPTGESVSGAYNRIWGSMNGGYYDNFSAYPNHRNIYLMYQGTVDLKNPVNNGEASMDSEERNAWFTAEENAGDQTGFCFSRIKGTAARKKDGLHLNPLLCGTGVRQNLLWSYALWPNIADLQIYENGSVLSHGRHSLSIGTTLDLRYIALDYDSSSTVTLHADIDRNPYNSNDVLSLSDPVQHTATGKTFIENTVHWNTVDMTDGIEIYVYAKISDGLRKRYFYSPAQLVFAENPKGDIDRNGKVDLSDVIVGLKIITGLSTQAPYADADVNGDGKIGIQDVVYILQIIAKLR